MFFASKYVNLDVGSDSEEEIEGDIEIKLNDAQQQQQGQQRPRPFPPSPPSSRGERDPVPRNSSRPPREAPVSLGVTPPAPQFPQSQSRPSMVFGFSAPPPELPLMSTPSYAPLPEMSAPAIVRKVKVRKLDTNVISLELGTALDTKVPIATGDAHHCRSCSAFHSAKSVIVTKSRKTDDPDEQPRKVWECEFCGTRQKIFLEDEEMPKEESVDYLLPNEQSSSSVSEGDERMNVDGPQQDSMIVFCVDISGSMRELSKIQGKIKLKGFDVVEELKSRDEKMHRLSMMKDVTFVSRLQCVQAAVDSQLEDVLMASPNTRVCLVTFEENVIVWGDGSQEPLIISGDKLSDYDQLVKEGKVFNTIKPISESIEMLRKKLFSLRPMRMTALGPGLLVSLSLISNTAGSRVIVCTDGAANVGLGKFGNHSGLEAAEAFYKRLGAEAVAQASMVSIVSFKGTDCRLEYLSPVAHETMGDIVIVDPADIAKQFSNILAEPIIASGVSITLLLHHGLFCREDPLAKKDTSSSSSSSSSSADVSSTSTSSSSSSVGASSSENAVKKVLRDIGNVTKGTTTTLEYGIDKDFRKQLFKEHEEGKNHITSIPFQVQIRFKRLSDGMELVRVITKSMGLAFDRKVAEQDVQLGVLAQHTHTVSSTLAMRGDYSHSRAYGFASNQFMGQFAGSSASNAQTFGSWQQSVHQRNTAIQQTQMRERAQGLNLSDDEEDNDEEAQKLRQKKERVRREQRSDEMFQSFSSRPRRMY